MNKVFYQFYGIGVILLCSLATTVPVQAQFNSDGTVSTKIDIVNPGISCQQKFLNEGTKQYCCPLGAVNLSLKEEEFKSLPDQEKRMELKEKSTNSVICRECLTYDGKPERFSAIENRCKRC